MERTALERLILLAGEFDQLLEEAKSDSPSRWLRAQLSLSNIDHALALCQARKLSEPQLREWAEFLEMHEMVNYDNTTATVIADLLFRIATPEVSGPLDDDSIRGMRSTAQEAM